MRSRLLTLTCVATTLSWALTAPTSTAQEASDPPGTVLASSPMPAEHWLPGTGSAQLVTYTSKTSNGSAATVTGAVFVPSGTAPEGGWPVVSWAHGTVGLGDDCAPTRTGRSERDITYLTHWLKQGYAVVATDYAGLGSDGVHPYLDGRTAAYGAIDMVRAARSITPSLSSEWVVIGQSQGGHAALFATEGAAEYAPELDFRGGVATGPANNLEYVVSGANPLIPDFGQPALTAFLSYILAGLRAARPDFDVDSYLSELGKDIVADAEVLCFDEQVERVKGVPIGALLSKPLTDPAFFAAIRDVMEVPVKGHDEPYFIAQGAMDITVWPPLTAKLAGEMAVNNQPMTFRTYPSDHSGTMAASLPDTTPFVAKLFEG